MVTKQTDSFAEAAAKHDNVDLYDGQKFPEGIQFTFVQTTKENGSKAMHNFTFVRFGKSTKDQIVFGTTIGSLALNMLRRQPQIHFSIEEKIVAPDGTLNRAIIDTLAKKIAESRLNGQEPTDGEIGNWAYQAIKDFSDVHQANVTFVAHRIPYYANTYDSDTETFVDIPTLKWQIHLYPKGAQLPAKENSNALKAHLKEKYGIVIDNNNTSAKDVELTIVPVEQSGNKRTNPFDE